MNEFVSLEYDFVSFRKRLKVAWSAIRYGKAVIVLSLEDYEESIMGLYDEPTDEDVGEAERGIRREILERTRAMQ